MTEKDKQCPCGWKRCIARTQQIGQEATVKQLKQQWLEQWPAASDFIKHTVQAKTSVVINPRDRYTFNGKKLKAGTYQVTSYNSDMSETERELEAQNAFESLKKVTSAPGWYYMGEISAENTKKIVCKKHDQAYILVEGCPWCE